MEGSEAKTPITLNIEDAIEFAKDGIVSKTITDQPHAKVILFCMASGQSLSEHTASVPAAIHFIQGTGQIALADQEHSARPGVWLHLPAQLPHSIYAAEDLVFLLTLFKSEG
jgi:quercetin dioxygenase-like cupin family protein